MSASVSRTKSQTTTNAYMNASRVLAEGIARDLDVPDLAPRITEELQGADPHAAKAVQQSTAEAE